MTTCSKTYDLTAEQRSLLRDLIVYMIAGCDKEIAQGKTAPFIAKRSYKLDILSMLSEGKEVRGMDGILFTLREVAKLCNEVPESLRENYMRTTLWSEKNVGLVGILTMYSNETIAGLKTVLLGEPVMSSTNDFW